MSIVDSTNPSLKVWDTGKADHMSQVYSDPSRANDPHALPNVETFYAQMGEFTGEEGFPCPSGWYWQACFPGCLPDGDPIGPFDSEEEAIADAQGDDFDPWCLVGT